MVLSERSFNLMAFNNLLQITGNLLAPEDPSLLRPETTLHVLPASGVSLSVTYGSLTGSVTTATALAHLQTETTSCESVNEVGFLRWILGICVFSFFCWFGGPMGSLEIFVFGGLGVCNWWFLFHKGGVMLRSSGIIMSKVRRIRW